MIQAAERRPRPHGRRGANCPPARPRSPSGRRPRSSRSFRSWSRAAAIPPHCTTTPTMTCRPRISRIPDVSYVTVQGGDIREILVEVEPQALVAADLSIADVADRLGKEHRLKAVGRLDREACNIRCSPTPWPRPAGHRGRVIAEKNGQSIRLRDLGRVDRSATRTGPWRSAPTARTPWLLTVFRRLGGNALGGLAASYKPYWPTPPSRPRPASGSCRSTTRVSWSGPPSHNVRDAIVIGGR